ncbi:unnamed protein product [Nippostrongylus brasiliensis]|uniref:26S proteasome non-ATPase regulatory subunit 5 n=1 Tax=Nippostrongylus brasiliensis TaxID=27835 RepID=A0A0N4YK88_NIPBR|nr:unnamed protein product [Nippostrongylus brasiliensis]
MLLTTLETSPPHVVAALAVHLAAHQDVVTPLLNGVAQAVLVAFARRINHPDTYEQKGHYTAALEPMLQSLVNELSSDDVLVALTAMDALSDVAIGSPAAAEIVNESGAPQKIYHLLQSSKDAPDGGFIYPSCVKFFGSLCRVYPNLIVTFPSFVPAVIDMVMHFDLLDPAQRMLAFDTFAQIAYKREAKENLQNQLGDDLLLSQWFSYLGPPMPSVLLSLVQKPFPDLRMSALHTFGSLLSHHFGIQVFLGTTGFLDWLLDQSTEHEWEAGRLKADIIRSLINSNSPLIDAPLKLRMQAYFIAPKRNPEVEMML